MTTSTQIPEALLLKGVSVTAWPDGMLKTHRRNGTMTKKSDAGKDTMVLKLDDGRTFTDPTFPWLAN